MVITQTKNQEIEVCSTGEVCGCYNTVFVNNGEEETWCVGEGVGWSDGVVWSVVASPLLDCIETKLLL